jgi:uncharacterized protein (TIGR02466 family)
MKNNFTVYATFPVGIYKSKIDNNLTEKQIKFVEQQKTYKPEGNFISFNSFVLNEKIFKSLNKKILDHVNNYLFDVLQCERKITPYITQSWLNYTEQDQFHHEHSHANSYLSGVYYIEANKEIDNITFLKPNAYATISPSFIEYNTFNLSGWQLPVETQEIVVFPSFLAHKVITKKENNKRISLAFNIFIKGEIGTQKERTFLKL